jgi:hypothetical protein
MSNQPRRQSAALAFDRDEWELIVTLPRRVLMTALASAPGERRAAEGIAGIEAIASGLASPSSLVREVVGSIYSENHREPEELIGERDDGDAGAVQTLAACRYASEVLGARCDPHDAAAYRQWVSHIAAVVTGVAQTGTAHTGRLALAESRFVYALGGVLRP